MAQAVWSRAVEDGPLRGSSTVVPCNGCRAGGDVRNGDVIGLTLSATAYRYVQGESAPINKSVRVEADGDGPSVRGDVQYIQARKVANHRTVSRCPLMYIDEVAVVFRREVARDVDGAAVVGNDGDRAVAVAPVVGGVARVVESVVLP